MLAHADVLSRGVYPWQHSGTGSEEAAPCVATVEQLLTQLHMHSSEMARAEEELSLLEAERSRCIRFLKQQQAAIQASMQRIEGRQAALGANQPVAPCSSFAACQPTSTALRQQEQQYCSGLLMLLSERLQSVTSQLDAASVAFAATDWDEAAVLGAPVDEYETDGEDAM